MKFYLNGVDLKACLVTQNAIGVYYYDKDDGYWRTTIDKFDTATPPSPYKKYTNGSHTDYLSQRAYDFYGERFWKITCDKDVKITKHYGQSVGYGVEFTCEGLTFVCAHTADHPPVGTVVKAGDMITQVAQYSGIAVHLHMYCAEVDLKDVILGTSDMENMKYSVNTKLRKGQGLDEEVIGIAKAGAVGKIQDGPRSADGYTWWDVAFGKQGSQCYNTGWIIEGERTNEVVTCLDASPIEDEPTEPPVTPPDCSECEERVRELEGQVEKLQDEIDVLDGQIEKLENDLKDLQVDYDNCVAELKVTKSSLKIANETIVKKNAKINELETEVEALKKALEAGGNWFTGFVNTLFDTLLSWFDSLFKRDSK